MGILSNKGAGALMTSGVVALAIAAFAAPQASAAVTTCPTAGAAITGQGASLQGVAQGLWTTEFNAAPRCITAGARVAYTANSSGTGLRAWGAASTPVTPSSDSYIGTDDPPSIAQINNMETNSGARVRIIPAAQAAISVIVNLPASCSLVGTPASVGIDNDDLEAAFRSGTSTFNDLLGAKVTGAGCATPVTRTVRGSDSGTTFQFKDFLNHIVVGGWTVDPTTTWPNRTSNLHSAADTASGPNLVSYVNSNAGTVGYANLSDAVVSFSVAPSGGKFIATVQNNGVGGGSPTYASPQVTALGVRSANCASTAYTGVPTSTLSTSATWFNTSGANPRIGGTSYPACTLTYDVAYNGDYGVISGRTSAEGDTAGGYIQYLVDPRGGQAQIRGNNYAPLPGSILTLAQTGAAAIG